MATVFCWTFFLFVKIDFHPFLLLAVWQKKAIDQAPRKRKNNESEKEWGKKSEQPANELASHPALFALYVSLEINEGDFSHPFPFSFGKEIVSLFQNPWFDRQIQIQNVWIYKELLFF